MYTLNQPENKHLAYAATPKVRLFMKAYFAGLVLVVSQTVYAAPPNTTEASLTSQDLRLIGLAKELCLSPDKEGKQWKVAGNAKLGAKAPVRIVKLDGGLNFEFSREQWAGVQRVLPGDQKADNKRFSDCTTTLLPMLKTIVYPPTPPQKAEAQKAHSVSAKPPQAMSQPAKAVEGNISISTGAITDSKVINQGEVNGNVTIDMSN